MYLARIGPAATDSVDLGRTASIPMTDLGQARTNLHQMIQRTQTSQKVNQIRGRVNQIQKRGKI